MAYPDVQEQFRLEIPDSFTVLHTEPGLLLHPGKIQGSATWGG